MYPSLLDLQPPELHSPTAVPLTKVNNEWENFDTHISPSLHKFYNGGFKHGIKIPLEDREEMNMLLNEGPPDVAPPPWVQWDVYADVDDSDSSDVDESSSDVSEDAEPSEYRPFLELPKNKDGRTCRCGSQTHLTTSSHACPLNPRNIGRTDTRRRPRASVGEDNCTVPMRRRRSSVSDSEDSHVSNSDDSHVSDSEGINDSDIDTPVPNVARGQRCSKTYCKRNARVDVWYENKWWSAQILFKHRGNNGYAVKYNDDQGSVQQHVPLTQMRKSVDI